MIRFLLRFAGLLLLALAFILVIYDGTRSLAAGAISATTGSQLWIDLNAGSLQNLQTAVEGIDGRLWQYALAPLLDQPAAAAFTVLGIVLILLGRKKRPLIGYARD